MGIRVGDHLEGPAAAKRGLCCREGLGHPQLKAPIPEEAGCVELCPCGEGRRLSRRSRERCTSVAGTRAGRAAAPQEQAWLPLWLPPGQALDVPCLTPQQPGGPVGLQGQRQGAQPHCRELVAGGQLRRYSWALCSSPTPLALSAWPSPPAGGGALSCRAWHLVVEGLAPFCLESAVRVRPAHCPRRT